jgi:N-acetylmuramoyl-L-alanine amidase
MNRRYRSISQAALILSLLALTGCALFNRPGRPLARKGDEIVVAGQLFHTGTKVVTWMDPGGYDAYRVERRFSALDVSDWAHSTAEVKYLKTPNRYGMRRGGLSDAQVEQFRGGGWELPALQGVIDQFVIHYDEAGISKYCFTILQDHRDLSVHFMLDVDGTIYQTLDVKERAWQATTSNDRSIGIEIANIGAYAPDDAKPLVQWYLRDADNQPYIRVPAELGDPRFRMPNFTGRPARPVAVRGVIQGQTLEQYDLTPQQYAALIRLTATLCQLFPKLTCDYPRDASGRLIPAKLPDDALAKYHGVLGHYHIQTNKIDPGPAFQWDKVINGARRLLRLPTLPEGAPGAP